MNFTFHLANCAAANNDGAKLRESTRVGLLCLCLRKLGHDAFITNAPQLLIDSPRWKFFLPAYRPGVRVGLEVRAAEEFKRGGGRTDVAVKCSIGTANDTRLLNHCDLLVAHEYSPEIETSDKLLKVPFLIHDRVIEHLVEHDLFQAYIDNDLQAIRDHFANGKSGVLGFCGCGWPFRKAFCADAPDWAEIRFFDSHPMSGGEHAKWLMGFKAALALRGDTPKTNLPPLLAMLGIPIVMEPITAKDTPPFNALNTIPFQSWEQVHAAIQDDTILAQITAKATDDYINGWSPMGQARQIAERVGA